MKYTPYILVIYLASALIFTQLYNFTLKEELDYYHRKVNNGQTFSMVTLSDRVDVFRLDGKPLWYVCDGYIVDELKDLSICLSK